MDSLVVSNAHSEHNISVTANANDFIIGIKADDIQSLTFNESLICYSTFSVPIGTYECKVETKLNEGTSVLFLKVYSNALLGEIECSTTMEAYITYSLETIKQTKSEIIKLAGKTTEKIQIIYQTPHGFEITQKESINDQVASSLTKHYAKEAMIGFVSDGADLILQRLLVKKPYLTPFEVIGLDSNNDISLVSYVDLGERNVIVATGEVGVKGIQRTIHSKSGMPLSWQTYLMDDGHLILRFQIGSPITIKASTVPDKCSQEQLLPAVDISQIALNWEDDLELYSRFLDRKDEIKAQYLLYLRDHPEIRDLLSDFIQSLLLHKPEEVIKYSVAYFKTLSVKNSPHNFFPSLKSSNK